MRDPKVRLEKLRKLRETVRVEEFQPMPGMFAHISNPEVLIERLCSLRMDFPNLVNLYYSLIKNPNKLNIGLLKSLELLIRRLPTRKELSALSPRVRMYFKMRVLRMLKELDSLARSPTPENLNVIHFLSLFLFLELPKIERRLKSGEPIPITELNRALKGEIDQIVNRIYESLKGRVDERVKELEKYVDAKALLLSDFAFKELVESVPFMETSFGIKRNLEEVPKICEMLTEAIKSPEGIESVILPRFELRKELCSLFFEYFSEREIESVVPSELVKEGKIDIVAQNVLVSKKILEKIRKEKPELILMALLHFYWEIPPEVSHEEARMIVKEKPEVVRERLEKFVLSYTPLKLVELMESIEKAREENPGDFLLYFSSPEFAPTIALARSIVLATPKGIKLIDALSKRRITLEIRGVEELLKEKKYKECGEALEVFYEAVEKVWRQAYGFAIKTDVKKLPIGFRDILQGIWRKLTELRDLIAFLLNPERGVVSVPKLVIEERGREVVEYERRIRKESLDEIGKKAINAANELYDLLVQFWDSLGIKEIMIDPKKEKRKIIDACNNALYYLIALFDPCFEIRVDVNKIKGALASGYFRREVLRTLISLVEEMNMKVEDVEEVEVPFVPVELM